MAIRKSKPVKKLKYDEAFKSTVCLEVMSGNLSITEARRMYGIKGRSAIHKWMRELQDQTAMVNLQDMNIPDLGSQQNNPSPSQDDLHRRNQELEDALKMAKLKITALETMIDIAESELKIDIRKKSGTKQ
jgi:transposase